MAYSARLRKAIGAVRLALESSGLGMQSPEFARHGEHQAAPTRLWCWSPARVGVIRWRWPRFAELSALVLVCGAVR